MKTTLPHIYKHYLKHTNKFYIGKHNGKNSSYKGSGIEWKKDLKKYVKNFKKEIQTDILEYVDDISKLNKREVYWLNKFDVVNNPLFYNKTNKSYGVCKTEEHTKLKQSLASPKRKSILQYDLEGNFIKEWNCMNDASKKLKISVGDLTNVCKNRQKTAGKFQWFYYYDGYSLKIQKIKPYKKTEEFKLNQSIILKNKPKPKGFGKHRYKAILQLDKNNNIIKEYNSIREACSQFGENVTKIESNIGSCVNNKQKTAYGYVWKFKEE